MSAISASISKTTKKITLKIQGGSALQRVPYIHYPTQFDDFSVEALIDLGSKVNVMQPSFAKKLDIRIYKTNVGAQDIDDNKLEIYGMLTALWQVYDKNQKFCFIFKLFCWQTFVWMLLLKSFFSPGAILRSNLMTRSSGRDNTLPARFFSPSDKQNRLEKKSLKQQPLIQRMRVFQFM